jgi:hypothetical protein
LYELAPDVDVQFTVNPVVVILLKVGVAGTSDNVMVLELKGEAIK